MDTRKCYCHKNCCWLAITAEWVPDYLMPERQVISKVATKRAGSYSLQLEYVMTQVEVGLVPAPSFLSAPVQAGSRVSPSQTKKVSG